MAFNVGFEKNAGKVPRLPGTAFQDAVRGVGKAVAAPIKTMTESGRTVRKTIGQTAKSFSKGFEEGKKVPRFSPTGAPKPDRGTALSTAQLKNRNKQYRSEVRARKRGEDITPKPVSEGEKTQIVKNAPKAIKERAKQIKRGPSFAVRHPLLTAGGGFLAGKAVFGGSEKKPEGPQIIYPNTSGSPY